MQQHHTEEWRQIPDTDGFYEASSEGRIRSVPADGPTVGRQRGRVLSPKPNPRRKGYMAVRLCVPGRQPMHVGVHQAVALAFLGPCPEGHEVNHKDGDKTNNRPGNLEYKTGLENIRHSWDTGLHADDDRKGEAHNMAKLTNEKVRTIRAEYPGKTLDQLAAEHGVTKQAVWMAVTRKTWTHI